MARNDDRIVSRRGEIGVARRERSVDAAAGRVVDERVDSIPESIAGVKDIGFGKGDGDIAVGVPGPVILQAERDAVELQVVLGREHPLGIPPDGCGKGKL